MARVGNVYGDINSPEGGGLDYWTCFVCGSVYTADCNRKVYMYNVAHYVLYPSVKQYLV